MTFVEPVSGTGKTGLLLVEIHLSETNGYYIVKMITEKYNLRDVFFNQTISKCWHKILYRIFSCGVCVWYKSFKFMVRVKQSVKDICCFRKWNFPLHGHMNLWRWRTWGRMTNTDSTEGAVIWYLWFWGWQKITWKANVFFFKNNNIMHNFFYKSLVRSKLIITKYRKQTLFTHSSPPPINMKWTLPKLGSGMTWQNRRMSFSACVRNNGKNT